MRASEGTLKPAFQVAEPNHDTVLTTRDLACFRSDRWLFRRLNLELSAGEALHVHGPNGSGKTSLLRILCGLTPPTSGEILWRGVDITNDPWRYRMEILYIGHHNGIKLELSPVENLQVARALAQNPTELTPEDALARWQLAGFEDVPSHTLSAGQRRRIALARLMMNKARVWVLDEPFTALDPAGVGTMETLIHEHLNHAGVVIFTTHQSLQLTHTSAKVICLNE